jgi:hypothetical protein
MPALPPEDRPKNYPVVGDQLQHAHCDQTGIVIAVGPHSEPRKTRQCAVKIRTNHGREVTFEMSVRNFWFNWTPIA